MSKFTCDLHDVYTSVGWVSQFYDIHQVWFSQNNLQKGLVILQFLIF
jgi:hypothetical protein